MNVRPFCPRLFLAAMLFINLAALAQLPQDPAINQNDTYAIFDVSIQKSATVSFTQPVYDSNSGTSTTSLDVGDAAKSYHIEVGYDQNDQLVMDIYPNGPIGDPTSSDADDLSRVQIINGKMNAYDSSGNLIPIALPQNGPLPQPLKFLGQIPSSSVLAGLIITDPYATAAAMNGTVQQQTTTCQNGGSCVTTATVSASYQGGGGGNNCVTYQRNGSIWVAVQASMTPASSNTQSNELLQFSGMTWSDNSSGDTRRQAKANAPPPAPSAGTLTVSTIPLTPPSTNSATVQTNILGIGPNMVFQHGIHGSASSWDRMYHWLSSDFQFGTVLIPSLKDTDHLANQAADLAQQVRNSSKSLYIIVGHSQGGLIGRDVAQRLAGAGLVQGVVTLDTPNNGALLALTSRVAASTALVELLNNLLAAAGCSSFEDNPACFVAFLIVNYGGPVGVNYAFDTLIPASGDLVPGSAYLLNLNGRVLVRDDIQHNRFYGAILHDPQLGSDDDG